MDIFFWSKLLKINLILFEVDKELILKDSNFFFLKNWAFHFYIPINNKSYLLLGFFKNLDENLDYLKLNIIGNFVIINDFKKIFIKMSKLKFDCDYDFNKQHCMWVEQQIFSSYLDSLCGGITDNLPNH